MTYHFKPNRSVERMVALQTIKSAIRPVVTPAKYILSLLLISMIAGCMSFGVFDHNHNKQPVHAVVFSGLAAYEAPGDTTKAFQEPTFIFLNGVEGRHITWTLSGQDGDTAEFEGLHFMEEIKRDPDPRTPFTGTFTLEAGHSMTLRLKPGSNDPVYEYDITITKRGGASFPVNYPPKVIP